MVILIAKQLHDYVNSHIFMMKDDIEDAFCIKQFLLFPNNLKNRLL
jgi:hypothetical protein